MNFNPFHKQLKMISTYLCAGMILVAVSTIPSVVMAQSDDFELEQTSGVLEGNDEVVTAETYSGLQETLDRKLVLREPSVFPNQLRTLFFTFWQHALLQEAKRKFNTANPDQMDPFGTGSTASFPREIALGGISYNTSKQWTVWLNGKRVTPEAIPTEIIDIKVADEFVDLKWYDGATQIIYPVRLRPHERFNLDTRIFITGTPPTP